MENGLEHRDPSKNASLCLQVISGSLPTSAEKNQRHMGTLATCALCGRDEETSFHALLVCPNAARLWDSMQSVWPLPSRMDITCTGTEWLLHMLVEAQESIRSRIIMMLWRIWYLRNEIIHGKPIPPLDISCSFLSSYYNSYKNIFLSVEEILKGKTPVMECAPPLASSAIQPARPWPAPASNVVALCVDGSYNPLDGSAGSGMILRDDIWTVIFASYRKLFHCNEALEAELQAMKEGLQLATAHSPFPVVLQSDCAVALKMITIDSFDRSAYGHLVSEIRRFLLDREVFPLKVSREQNRVAHCLANFGRDVEIVLLVGWVDRLHASPGC